MNIEEYNTFINSGLRQMQNIDVAKQSDRNYLGQVDADTEWNDSPEVARQLFVHTRSYQDFIERDALILLGRTGTGKTAILRRIEDNIKNRNLDQYSYILNISFDQIMENLTSFDEIDNSAYSRISVEKSIRGIINIMVMKELVSNNKSTDDLKTIYQYLSEKGLLDESSIVTKLKKIAETLASSESKAGVAAKIVVQLTEINNVLFEGNYKNALEEVYRFLKNRKMMVLIDSSNEYNMRDTKSVVIVKALISECFNFHTNRSSWNIYVKIALPAEVYTHILQHLPGKQRGNTVVINWRYTDLTNFIARRIAYYMSRDKYSEQFNFLLRHNFSYYMNDDNCKELLQNIFPPTCPTSLGYHFDTIAYCIKHTLKKPRELLIIFNALLNKIIESKDLSIYYNKPDEIKNVIHSTQEELIGSALSMYDNSYPHIADACSIVLKNQNFIFKGQDIAGRLKEAAAHIATEGYGQSEIKRVLLESGLVGSAGSCDFISANSILSNPNMVQVINARFEYQIKGNLMFNKDDFYVIHPMCYEHFTCYLAPYVLVYADKNSDELDIIHTILESV